MKRAGVLFVAGLALALAAVSGAASRMQTVDRVCSNLVNSRNPHAYPPDRLWVWTIPNGCIFTTERPRPAGCTPDPDLGCAAPPDVHVHLRGRDYVFHLTMKRTPANARGITTIGG